MRGWTPDTAVCVPSQHWSVLQERDISSHAARRILNVLLGRMWQGNAGPHSRAFGDDQKPPSPGFTERASVPRGQYLSSKPSDPPYLPQLKETTLPLWHLQKEYLKRVDMDMQAQTILE